MDKELLLKTELSGLEKLFLPYGYQLDTTQDMPFFWKTIAQNDLRSPYAFSLVLITMRSHTVTIEGLNEPRLKRAIRAGLIEINTEEDVDALKELVFEATYDDLNRLQTVLPFFETQLTTIQEQPIYSDGYKRALGNIALLAEAAAELE